MNRFYGMGEMPQQLTLVVNAANAAVQSVKDLGAEEQKFVAEQIYYLALLSYRKLTPEEMKAFTANNLKLLQGYSKKD